MMEKTKEYRKELAELFIQILEEKELNWRKGWNGNDPKNAKSGYQYRGINRLRLMIIAMQRGYEDSRWATFNQIRDMGCRLNDAKGQGVKVEYWFPYDVKEKHAISWKEFHELTEGKPDERYVLRASYSTVFNGALIEGLQEPSEQEQLDITIDDLVDTISHNMEVDILNDGGDRAFYRLSEDKIHLPKPESFFSDYEYNSTALHELAHATGAEKRLNRNMGSGFGSPEYAYEELVAEITSCFISANLQEEQDKHHIENHRAYVQSWIKSVREKPETLVRAVTEAEKAAAYMEFMAGLIQRPELEQVMNSSMEVEKPQQKLIHKKKLEVKGPKL